MADQADSHSEGRMQASNSSPPAGGTIDVQHVTVSYEEMSSIRPSHSHASTSAPSDSEPAPAALPDPSTNGQRQQRPGSSQSGEVTPNTDETWFQDLSPDAQAAFRAFQEVSLDANPLLPLRMPILLPDQSTQRLTPLDYLSIIWHRVLGPTSIANFLLDDLKDQWTRAGLHTWTNWHSADRSTVAPITQHMIRLLRSPITSRSAQDSGTAHTILIASAMSVHFHVGFLQHLQSHDLCDYLREPIPLYCLTRDPAFAETLEVVCYQLAPSTPLTVDMSETSASDLAEALFRHVQLALGDTQPGLGLPPQSQEPAAPTPTPAPAALAPAPAPASTPAPAPPSATPAPAPPVPPAPLPSQRPASQRRLPLRYGPVSTAPEGQHRFAHALQNTVAVQQSWITSNPTLGQRSIFSAFAHAPTRSRRSRFLSIRPGLGLGSALGHGGNAPPGGGGAPPHPPDPGGGLIPGPHGGDGGDGGGPPGGGLLPGAHGDGGGRPPAGDGGGGDSNPGPTLPDGFRSKPWSVKPDATVIPTLRDDAKAHQWSEETIIQLRGLNLSTLIPSVRYIPMTALEEYDFDRQQAWLYAAFDKRITAPISRAILLSFRDTYDARGVLHAIRWDASASAAGIVRIRQLRLEILTLRLDDHWRKSQAEFIVTSDGKIRLHNDIVRDPGQRITPAQAKEYLQTSVHSAPNLRDIFTREIEAITKGEPPYSYDQSLMCLTTAAQLYDSARSGSRTGTRRGFLSDITGDTEPEPPDDGGSDATPELDVNAAVSNRPRLDADVWTRLSSQARKTWRDFSDTDKATILGATGRSANIHALDPTSDPPDSSSLDVPDDSDPPGSGDCSAHRAEAGAPAPAPTGQPLRDAHPGDPRRLQSPQNAVPSGSRKAKTVAFDTPPASGFDTVDAHVAQQISQYWSSCDSDASACDEDWFDARDFH